MAWTIIYRFVDNKHRLSTTTCNLPSDASLAHVTEFATTFATILDNMSNSKLGGLTIQTSPILSTQFASKPIATKSADNEEKGAFSFQTSHTSPKVMKIPGFKDSLVMDGSDLIDQSAPDVAAYLAVMIDGLTLADSTVIEPCDVGSEDIFNLISAREEFTKSRRRRR